MINASLGERTLAFVTDLLLVFAPLALLSSLASVSAPSYTAILNTLGITLTVALMLLNTLLSLMNGQSVGKRVFHLQVVDMDGNPLSPAGLMQRSFWTALFFALSALGLSTVDGAMAAWRSDGRSLHDLLAGSRVVSERRNPLSPEGASSSLQVNADGTLAQIPAGWEPVDRAPTLFTLNLIGTMMFSGQAVESSGRILCGTLCFVVCLIPVVGFRQYLYSRDGNAFRFFASAPVSSAFATWNVGVATALVGALLFGLFCVLQPRLQLTPEPPGSPSGAGASPSEAGDFVARQAEEALAQKDYAAAVTYAEICRKSATQSGDKARLRRSLEIIGKAESGLKHFPKAEKAYMDLLSLEPQNRDYQKALKECRAHKAKHS